MSRPTRPRESYNVQLSDNVNAHLGGVHNMSSVALPKDDLKSLAEAPQGQRGYKAAEGMDRWVLEGREKVLGREHSETLTTVSNLAGKLGAQGKYEATEEMNRRALEGREKVLGREDADTLTSASSLASVLRLQGKYEAAQEMYRRAIEGREKVLGREDAEMATSASNLAFVLQFQGRYETAEKMYQLALEEREKVLGREDPKTLTSVSDLAGMLGAQGKYEAAEEMDRRALEGREKVLGSEHPETLTSVANLAWVLGAQGKHKAAEEMYRRALEGNEKARGKEHLETLTSNLAGVLGAQGKYEAAEEMDRRALEGREKRLGRENPETLTSVSNLAGMLGAQGKYEAAEEMNRRALEGREKVLGREVADTLTSVNNLASVLRHQGKYEEAEELFRRALTGRKKVLGRAHPSTLMSANNLAMVLQDQGKYEATEELFRQALTRREMTLGDIHPDTHPDTLMSNDTDYCGAISRIVKQKHDVTEEMLFTIHWELQDFVLRFRGGDKDLGSVLTVTGNADTAYGTTCHQYINWKWGNTGLQVLDLIPGLLQGNAVHTQVDYMYLQLIPSELECFAQLAATDTEIAVSVVQVLAWMASVFRAPKIGPPHCSNLQLPQGDEDFSITLGDLDPAERGGNTRCWHDLLPNTTIASGFPVRMPEQTGLDIDWEVMLDLADILYQTDLSVLAQSQSGHGIFYSGVGTLLYPVSRSSGPDNVIRWHFDSSGETVIPPPGIALPVLSEEDFSRSKHMVGFASQSQVHLGTRERAQNYAQMTSVTASIERGRPEFKIETFTAQFGKAPVMASIGGRVRYSQALRATADPDKRRYDQVLRATEKQAVILIDSGTSKAAWLVSQLSVILDLVCYRIYKQEWDRLPIHATPQADGGAAAAEVLRDPNVYNRKLPMVDEDDSNVRILHLVKEIYIAMSQRRILHELPASATQKLHRNRLLGWDLLELAEPPDQSFRREITVHKTTSLVIAQYPSWLPLAKHIPVYIGQDLGDIVTADLPISLQTLERREKYLIASVRAMRPLLKSGISCVHFHLDCELVWECPPTGQLLSISQPGHARSRQHYSPELLKRCIQEFIKLGHHKCTVEPRCSSLCRGRSCHFRTRKHQT